MDYEIVAFSLSDGCEMRVLARKGAQSFMEKMTGNPKRHQRAEQIRRAAERVARNGVEWAKVSKTLKAIAPDLYVYELRVPGKVIRVMTYLHNGIEPIYLFDFDGHQGKKGGIKASDIEKAQELAAEAAALLLKGGSDD